MKSGAFTEHQNLMSNQMCGTNVQSGTFDGKFGAPQADLVSAVSNVSTALGTNVTASTINHH